MATRTSDFPFTIMDVVELLRLHIRLRSPGYIYADCPLCGSQRGKLCINLTKNAWCSNCCGDSGGMLALYAKVQNVSNPTAYSEICDALLTGGFAPEYKARRQEQVQSEVVLSERAPLPVIHQTYSALLNMLQLIVTVSNLSNRFIIFDPPNIEIARRNTLWAHSSGLGVCLPRSRRGHQVSSSLPSSSASASVL